MAVVGLWRHRFCLSAYIPVIYERISKGAGSLSAFFEQEIGPEHLLKRTGLVRVALFDIKVTLRLDASKPSSPVRDLRQACGDVMRLHFAP